MKRFAWIFRTMFGKSTLRQLNIFTEEEIVYAVRTLFSWTHIRSLSALTDPLARQFYIEIDGKSLEEVLERSYIITLN